MSNDECSICLENFSNNFMCLPCNHCIHVECLHKLKKYSKLCPLCRKMFNHNTKFIHNTDIIALPNLKTITLIICFLFFYCIYLNIYIYFL